MVVENRSNKWEPYKIGFINFWVYEYEEYPFYNGKILFRGPNGHGKSVSMQSVVPMLLDGNKHPSRLDPFGSGKRKIIDYLKVKGEVDKGRISYLYFTYQHKGTKEIITTGVGLRATNETNVDFWGYIIKGKEIGKDFHLTKSGGYDSNGEEEIVPLAKTELKKVLEESDFGTYVDTQQDYAEEVNKNIFQFEDVGLFKELTNLLIQIRSPKLSKEMKPDILYDALKNALGELSHSDFSLISNTIKNIDERNRKIKKTEKDLQLAEELYGEYKVYKEKMLGHASQRYLEATGEKDSAQRKLNKKEKELIDHTAKLQRITNRLTDIDIELSVKRSKLNMLETPEIRSYSDERDKKIEEKKQKEGELKKKEKSLERNEERLRKYSDAIKKLENECYFIETDIKDQLSELDDLSEEIQFVEHSAYLSSADKNLNVYNMDKQYLSTWMARLKEHVAKLKSILAKIEEEARLKNLLMEKKEEIHSINSEIDKVEKEIRKIEQDFMSEQSNYKVNFREWVQNNKEFYVKQDKISQVIHIIDNLYDFDDMTPNEIERELSEYKDVLLEPIRGEHYQNLARIQNLEQDVRKLEEEKRTLENEKEVPPSFRRRKTVENRDRLLQKGIPFVPFYEAVEFSDTLTEGQRERIESALLDMGVLDSLIVPSQYIDEAKENDAVIVPHIISADVKTLDSVLKVVPPKDNAMVESDILNVLKSISLEMLEDASYVIFNGEYRHGILKGVAVEQPQTSFIGKEVRRRYRERKIAELEASINKKQEDKGEYEQKNIVLDQRKEALLTEYNNRPSLKVFSHLSESKNFQVMKMEQLENRKDKLMIAHDDLSKEYTKAQTKRIQATSFLNGPKDKDTICSMVELADNDYRDCLSDLSPYFHKYETKKSQFESNKEASCELEEQIDEAKGDINVLKGNIEKVGADIVNINEILKGLGIDEIEKEAEEARKRIKELENEQREKIDEKPRIENDIEKVKKEQADLERELTFLGEQLRVREEVLELEIKQNNIESSLSLKDVAKQYMTEDVDVQEAYLQLYEIVVNIRPKGLEDYSLTSKDATVGNRHLMLDNFPEKRDRVDTIRNERKRLIVTLFVQGMKKNPQEFFDYLSAIKDQQLSYLKKDEEALIKNVMIQGTGEKIRQLIVKAQNWRDDINRFMRSLNNSIELRLIWEPIDKKDSMDALTTSKLVELLGRDFSTLKDSDIEVLSKHFIAKINIAKEKLNSKNNKEEVENLEQALKQVLDYRDWYQFKIMYKLEGDKEKVLNEDNLAVLSGGEKAMAIYIPLFSAAFSKYSTASPDAPYLIALDEAFAGVDEENISEMFALIERLGFDYILTSQALWGDYQTVTGINIYELNFDKVEQIVYSEPWRWDGNKRAINMDVLSEKGMYVDEDDRIAGEQFQDELFPTVNK